MYMYICIPSQFIAVESPRGVFGASRGWDASHDAFTPELSAFTPEAPTSLDAS